jgi:hypothetical protein
MKPKYVRVLKVHKIFLQDYRKKNNLTKKMESSLMNEFDSLFSPIVIEINDLRSAIGDIQIQMDMRNHLRYLENTHL